MKANILAYLFLLVDESASRPADMPGECPRERDCGTGLPFPTPGRRVFDRFRQTTTSGVMRTGDRIGLIHCIVRAGSIGLLSESLHEIEKAVLSYRLISPGSRVVVGCSGGADSLALLSVLWRLRGELEIEVLAAHANHQLRGAESAADEAHVRRFCADRGIGFVRGDLEIDHPHAIGNLEDRARIARYDFLARTARIHGSVVVTGHTLDDQAETFLMKMIRGAGPGGLSGIAERRFHPDPVSGEPVLILRPFLAVSRSQIEEYLNERNLAFRTDRSNLDPTFDRNWVRRELMPLLEQRLNPQVRRTLGRTARLMGEIEHHLESEARQCLSEARLSEGTRGHFDSRVDGASIRHFARSPSGWQLRR